MSDNIEERVHKVIFDDYLSCGQPKLEQEEIREDHHLFDELGMDSLDHVGLAMAVEEEFQIEISDEEAEKWKRVSDIYECVRNNLEG
jgi:acyl carrier protein